MRACEFGVELDPRLIVLSRTPTPLANFVNHPTPDDWQLGFASCVDLGTSPRVLATYQVMMPAPPPGGPIPADLRVHVRGLLAGTPMQWGPCVNPSDFQRVSDSGGVLLNPSSPAIVRFAGSPPVLVEGRLFTLSWEAVLAEAVTLDGAPVDPTGIVHPAPTSDATFTLAATAGGHSVQSTVGVEVIRTPRIESFTAEVFVDVGVARARLAWSVVGATRVEVAGLGEVVPVGGALVDLSPSPTWTLHAFNEWGESVAVAELTAPEDMPPIVVRFAALPNPFALGDAVTLSWSLLGAASAVLQPGVGPIDPVSGQAVVTPAGTTTYTLSATNAHGTTNLELVLRLMQPGIASFTAAPPALFPGESATLAWNTSGATQLSIAPGVGPVFGAAGSVLVTPTTSETVYLLTASNGETEATAAATVSWRAPAAGLSASIQHPYGGEEFLLTVSLLGATQATLEPGFGAIPVTGGVFPATVTTPTTFVLTATNAAGPTVRTIVVTPIAPTAMLAASTTLPFGGQEFTLTATVEGATSVVLQPGFGAIPLTGGTFTAAVGVPTTFVLTAINPTGSTVRQVTVTPRAPTGSLTASNTTTRARRPVHADRNRARGDRGHPGAGLWLHRARGGCVHHFRVGSDDLCVDRPEPRRVDGQDARDPPNGGGGPQLHRRS